VKKVAVLGAGVMGAQIAGHLCGCGAEVILLDMPARGSSRGDTSAKRNSVVQSGLERLAKARPAEIYDTGDIKKIRVGNFEDDLEKIGDCDWIVEAVIERLDIKHSLYSKIDPLAKKNAVISSNTSGILWKHLTEGQSDGFKKRFVITHFFNPVRYMKLVEVVAGSSTDESVVKNISEFLEVALGKGVVRAKDTPFFIANRIGVHHVVATMEAAGRNNWPIEVVDQVMGRPTAHPKSAIFRTVDIVGLDTLALVAREGGLKLPAYVDEMIARKWVGEKAGQGFYKKQGKDIFVLDVAKMDYRPVAKIKAESLGAVKDLKDPHERVKRLLEYNDAAARIAWELLSDAIVYSASVLREIADSPAQIDMAMRWGFNWEIGPFEQLAAIGAENFITRLKKENRQPSVEAESVLKSVNQKNVYVPQRRARAVVEGNAGADITDLGDGIYACEFHTKMNAIDGDVVDILSRAVELAETKGKGLVIGNDGENFSAGANLMMIFLAISNGDMAQVEQMVKAFQDVNQLLRFCKRPVVAAPFGMALGGGCEITMACASAQSFCETYMGLVEFGVGLLPAGGGCKNMLLKMEERCREGFNDKNKIWYASEDGGPFPKVRDAFQTIAFARVSSSAKEAAKIGYTRRSDGVSMRRDHLIEDAKERALLLAKDYRPPAYREDILLPGKGGKMALVNSVRQARTKGDISEHDAVIAEKIAHVLSGGDRESNHLSSEQHILDLEREAFMSLCGTEKTRERIQFMLMNGKPLRN